MDAIARMMGSAPVQSATVPPAANVFGPGASYAVPGSTLPRGTPAAVIDPASGQTSSLNSLFPAASVASAATPPPVTTPPPSLWDRFSAYATSPDFAKNLSALSSVAAGVSGAAEGIGTARNLDFIRKQDARTMRIASKKLISSQKVGYAAAGVDVNEGTPIDVRSEAASLAARDQMLLKWRYRRLQTQAYLSGAAQTEAGLGQGFTTLLSKQLHP